MGFFSRCCSGKGPHLALRGESPGFSRVATLKFVFLLSYNGNLRDLRDLHGLPQESSVSMRAVRDGSGFFCSNCRGQGPHLELRPEPQVSSRGPLRIWGFLWGVHRGIKLRLVWSHVSPLSSQARKQCQASCQFDHRDSWLSLQVEQGCYSCHCILSLSSG